MCYGVGVGGLGYVSGYSEVYCVLEEVFVDWLGYLCVLLFIFGFVVNQVLIVVFVEKDDWIVVDCLSYVFLLEVVSFSLVQLWCFIYNDLQQFV